MVEVLKTGLYDTIQDLGRFGVQEFGVPFSGAMDLISAGLVNAILENSNTASVLEITIAGPKLKFHCDTVISLSGADLSPKLNSFKIKLNTRIKVNRGDVLSFGRRHYGTRLYLGVKGGFQTESIMNSYSMCAQITSAARLHKGDQLSILDYNAKGDDSKVTIEIEKPNFDVYEIKVFKGLEFCRLSNYVQKKLWSSEFTISINSNRMAYQIDEPLINKLEPIITSFVLPGTVQLTPSGQLIILMRDCQTTGGYPRILQVTESSINQLSQKFLGGKFRFKCID